MPLAVAQPSTVTARQRDVLEQIVRRSSSPQQLVARARIVLAAGEGQPNGAIARQLGSTRKPVRSWRRRWATAAEALLAAELEGDGTALEAIVRGVLADDPRPGTPATFTPEHLCAIVAIACEVPADADGADRPTSQWTPREVADEAVKRGIVAQISVRTVGRYLKRSRSEAPPESLLADPTGRRSGRFYRPGQGDLYLV